MKIKKKKRKKKNHGSQVCSQRDFSQSSFLRQCRKTLLITASYQLFSVCVSPTTAPLPPAKPVYDETLLSTVSNQVSQFFANPAFAAAPPVVGHCVLYTLSPGGAASMSSMPAAMGGMMIMNSIMQVAIQGLMQGAHNAQVRAQQKAQAAQIQQWLAAEQERIANLVAQQRSLRDAEVKAGQDELAKALSDQWDAGKGPTGLGSALSDPGVVRPQGTPFFGTGGDSSVADLRDRTRDIPEIPDGKKLPLKEKAFKPTPPSESARKLQQMMKDNHDPARLDGNLKNFENQLAKIKELSEKINKGMNFSPQDLQALNQSLTPVIQEGLLRGISLVMGLGPEDLITFYKEMKANPIRMNKLLDAMNTVNEFTNFAYRYDKFKPGELKDAMWNEANRGLMRDLDFFRTQNVVNSGQFQTGKNMIKESMDLAQSREELGKIEVRVKIKGLSPFFWDRKKQLDQQVQKLAETTRGARRDLALKKDLPPTPDKPVHASLKSSSVPSQESSVPTINNLKVIPLDLKQTGGQPLLTTKAPRGEPPLPGKKYKTVVFQGVVGSQREDQTFMKAIQNDSLLQNPDKSYGFVFPGGPQSDRLMLNPESNPDVFFKEFPEIKHMEIDRLVFTSNMAPFVKMLIDRRLIEVNTLFFISESFLKDYPGQEALMDLANKRNILFHWYLIRDGKLIVEY
jgi:hypothetical protein